MTAGQSDADASAAGQFLVLPENRFAHSVLLAWDTAPDDEAPPPVFLYGPSGTGKSHLVRDAIQRLAASHADWNTLSLTAAEFSARYAEAAESRGFRAFRKQFQQLDVLAIEDLQALAKKFEPQRQLVAALDDAVAHHCRLIITCRTSAAEVPELIPELVNRCHGSVSTPLRLPSAGSRERLLNHWATVAGLSLAPDVIPFLAEKFAVSPRELSGLLTQLRSISQQQKLTLNLDLVSRHLLGQHPNRVYPAAEIAKCVARQFQVTLSDVRSKSRQPRSVLPRQCAIFLIRELTDLSLQKIGDYFGGRDHSTILHACHKIETLLPEQPDLRQHLAKIRTQLEVPQ